MTGGDTSRVVIVGGGECAARAASALREHGHVGQIVVLADEPLAPYERPPLSKAALTDREPLPVTVLSAAAADEQKIDLLTGERAVAMDRQAKVIELASGARIPYDRALLATGARARALPVPGGELADTLRTFADAARLHARLTSGASVVVIGAGFIGLEAAASARRRGCRVTVVETATRAMGRGVPESVAEVLVKRHIAEQVDLRFDADVRGIEAAGDALVVDLGSSGGTLTADVVLAGVGAIPNTELATAAGLVVENGIAADAGMRTSDPTVFAAGDCCSMPHPLFGGLRMRLESWRMAREQATVAAANLAGSDEVCRAVPWFWSDQYDLTLQIIGVPALAVLEVVRNNADGTSVQFGLDATGRLVCASTVAGPDRFAVFKTIKLAERLIANASAPDPVALRDPAVNLRSLL